MLIVMPMFSGTCNEMVRASKPRSPPAKPLLNHLKYRISNVASEDVNSQVARIITNARGLACFENLRTRVLFFLGKLDLSPA